MLDRLHALTPKTRWLGAMAVAGFALIVSACPARAQGPSEAARRQLAENPRDLAAVEAAYAGWHGEAMKGKDARIQWWRDARFGCFIHWGASSSFGGEWKGKNVGAYSEHMMRTQRIPLAEYKEKVVAPFDPRKYDADEWVRLIQATGMRYVVFTAKHHDGLAMWPSDAYPYDIRLTEFFKSTGRDPVGELAAACRKAGIRFCVYYSHSWDWEHPDAQGNTWDYKPLADTMNVFRGKWEPEHINSADRAEKYIDQKAIPQIRELIARYHPDMFWFDTPGLVPTYLQLKVVRAVREADPNVIINGRATRGAVGNLGDYQDTADRPAETRAYDGDWQGVPTTNDSYGYHKLDRNYKPAGHFIQLIAKLAAKGGNTLLNMGPMGDGTIAPEDAAIFQGIGRWMAVNGESIYGTERTPLDRQAWGDSTIKGNTLYLHVFDWPADGKLAVGGIGVKPKAAYLLADKSKTALAAEPQGEKDLLVKVPLRAPDADDSVVVLEFDALPKPAPGYLLATNVKSNRLLAFDGTTVGKGRFGYGDGKANNHWVAGFDSPERKLKWELRTNASQRFNVTLTYSVESVKDGGTFTLSAGGQVLTGQAGKTTAVDSESVDAGQEVVGEISARGTRMTRDLKTIDLGTLSLPAGSTTLMFSPLEAKGKGINLFEVNLVPVAK